MPRLSKNAVCRNAVRRFGCDQCRIYEGGDGMMFAILGDKCVSKNEWVDERGKSLCFEYIKEVVAARGRTCRELWDGLKLYWRLGGRRPKLRTERR